MKLATVSTLPTRRRQRQTPYDVYLNTLSANGRRSLASLLSTTLQVLGEELPPARFDWCSLDYEDLVWLRRQLMDSQRSINTINATLAALRGVLRTGFHMGHIDADSMLRVTAIKCVKGQTLPKGRSLGKAQLVQLVKAARAVKGLKGERDSVIIQLLGYTGLRRDELIHLKTGDYAPQEGVLRVRVGKGRRQRLVPVPARIAAGLQRWIRRLGTGQQPLFCSLRKGGVLTHKPLSGNSIYTLVCRYADIADIGRCTPHDLRRTFITHQLERGVDINTVRRLAGHSDIQTTTLYDCRG